MIPKKPHPNKPMMLAEAAERIGVTTGRLRQLIRSGKLRARKVDVGLWRVGYFYTVSEAEVARFLRLSRKTVGRPRTGDRETSESNGKHTPNMPQKN